jgi:hypothetical protein
MTTLDISASIERIEANTARLKKINAEIEAELSTPPASPPAPFPWLVFGLGLSLGAAVVAISVLAIDWGLG